MSHMAKEFFTHSPLLLMPLIALVTFVTTYAIITVRAITADPRDIASRAALPLAEDEVHRD